MPASSFDCLFGDADGLLGSVFLDRAAPTLSAALLHCLAVTSGLIEISQAKVTYGHWRMKTQCKSDLTLHYWKSPAGLPAYPSSQVQALNPTTLTPLKTRIDVITSTKPKHFPPGAVPSCSSRNPRLSGCDLPGPTPSFRPYLSGRHPIREWHRFSTSIPGILFHPQVLWFHHQCRKLARESSRQPFGQSSTKCHPIPSSF
jgi:hypothetical protein